MNGIRHLGADSVQKTAEEGLENPHKDLVGFGLAGDELHFPPKLFVKTFDMLKEAKSQGITDIINTIHYQHPKM